jgi:hypothetical protein
VEPRKLRAQARAGLIGNNAAKGLRNHPGSVAFWTAFVTRRRRGVFRSRA